MSGHDWRFEPLDSWFFRESRPHGTVGGSELVSLFPPPARTLAGAVRTLLGDRASVDWAAFRRGEARSSPGGVDLGALLGEPGGGGQLRFSGPYLERSGERLYPTPAFLIESQGSLGCLVPADEPQHSDLGLCYLPIPREKAHKVRSLEAAWLDRTAFQQVLSGELPEPETVLRGLWREEPRLGIGRTIRHRTVAEGLLYQTRHVRLEPGLAIGASVDGVPASLLPNRALARLGGEGRLAAIEVVKARQSQPLAPATPAGAKGVLLVLVTPARLPTGWVPEGFHEGRDERGARVFRGQLGGVALSIVSAVIGRPMREGGWDLAREVPRPVASLLPAGTTWFARVEGDLPAAVSALEGVRVGTETEIGRGELAAGYWV